MVLLTPAASSPKLRHLEAELGLSAAILYMLPDERTCPWAARNGCLKPCLVNAGLASVYPTVKLARERKREAYFDDPHAFLRRLDAEVGALARRAAAAGVRPAVRLDGTSDLGLAWKLYASHPSVTFWDYTKGITRVRRLARLRESQPDVNLHLTFSRGADNEAECEEALSLGFNVAVPFRVRKGKLPAEWQGRPVLDGDKHDYRFLDPAAGVYVGLSVKGSRGKADTSGFVVDL